MRRMKKNFGPLSLVAMVAACGGDDASDAPAEEPAAEESAEELAEEAAEEPAEETGGAKEEETAEAVEEACRTTETTQKKQMPSNHSRRLARTVGI